MCEQNQNAMKFMLQSLPNFASLSSGIFIRNENRIHIIIVLWNVWVECVCFFNTVFSSSSSSSSFAPLFAAPFFSHQSLTQINAHELSIEFCDFWMRWFGVWLAHSTSFFDSLSFYMWYFVWLRWRESFSKAFIQTNIIIIHLVLDVNLVFWYTQDTGIWGNWHLTFGYIFGRIVCVCVFYNGCYRGFLFRTSIFPA